jgi:hypothetical protein
MRSVVFRTSAVVFLFFLVSAVFSEDYTIKPYGEDEFPGWVLDLRRAEIVLVGSLPFTMFAVLESYDLFRYFSHGLNNGYLPWPVKNPYGVEYTMEEKLGVVIGAVSLSLVITIIDYVIGKVFPPEERSY